MRKIAMFDVKTHLTRVIRDIQSGDGFCITNRNKEVAVLVSIEHYRNMKNADVFERLNRLKAKAPLGNVSEVISMRNQGRE